MPALTHSDLLPLAASLTERTALEARVTAHLMPRTIRLGEHAILQFEDKTTALHHAQEWIRSSQEIDAALIQNALDGYSALIPDGSNLKARMRFEVADSELRTRELARLGGIEHRVYAEVEGQGRSYAIVEETLPRGRAETCSNLVLRVEFSAAQIANVRAGAEFGFGIDDDRMRVAHTLKRYQRAALLADFV